MPDSARRAKSDRSTSPPTPPSRAASPINTDGGQLSGGQPGLAGGFRHVIEGARQIMGKAGVRQVALNDLCMVNG